MKILGADISTSCTGISVLDDSFNLLEMTHVEFKDCEDIWEKADKLSDALIDVCKKHQITDFYVEEPVLGFSPGRSSASTITLLMKFNYMVSYQVRKVMGITPCHVKADDARRTCGIKLQRKKICGKSNKEQTFDFMTRNDGPLGHIQIAMTKTGKPKPWVFDEVDSYTIARAGVIFALRNKG